MLRIGGCVGCPHQRSQLLCQQVDGGAAQQSDGRNFDLKVARQPDAQFNSQQRIQSQAGDRQIAIDSAGAGTQGCRHSTRDRVGQKSGPILRIGGGNPLGNGHGLLARPIHAHEPGESRRRR